MGRDHMADPNSSSDLLIRSTSSSSSTLPDPCSDLLGFSAGLLIRSPRRFRWAGSLAARSTETWRVWRTSEGLGSKEEEEDLRSRPDGFDDGFLGRVARVVLLFGGG